MSIILLVEDDRFLSDTVKSYLEFKQYEVDRAFEGPEALEKMKFGNYDLIILDWQLPGMDGPDVCRSYRQGGGAVPILMLTGRSDPKEMAKATEAGATGFLPKPFKLDQLDKTLSKMLGETVQSKG
jgi:OmpR-family two-component system manganese-sensing response regulator